MPDSSQAADRVGPPLAVLPTPLDAAPRLSQALGVRLFVKREDLSGYGLGGNKLRKLDLLFADLLARGCDTAIATAGAQSNFCRSLAAGCARLGLGCTLVLRGPAALPRQGNLLLDRMFGAELRFIDASDPWDPRIRAMMDACAAELAKRGHRPAVIQLTGDSAGLAASAWVAGARELDAQWRARGIDPERLVLAVGSGLTMLGLALGLRACGRRCVVTGISVQQEAGRLRAWLESVAPEAARHAGLATNAPPEFDLWDEHRGPAYGVPSPASLAAVGLAGRSEGLVLDPVYTGKALGGLAAEIESGRIARGSTVVFLHSGGTPALFVHSNVLAEHLG